MFGDRGERVPKTGSGGVGVHLDIPGQKKSVLGTPFSLPKALALPHAGGRDFTGLALKSL
jgi:hypothetical protein